VQLSACIEWLFAREEDRSPQRVYRAAEAGLPAVEFWGWTFHDTEGIAEALQETGLALTAFSSEPVGRIVDPKTHEEWLGGVSASSQVAATLGCSYLMVNTGDALPGVSRSEQHRAVVEALKAAGPLAREHGVTLLLEPLNTKVDHVGHFLESTREGLDIVVEVDHPAVALIYDMYHSVVMGEQPRQVLAGRLDRVRHVHVADVPGRREPGTGTIDWEAEMGWLAENGYSGRIGLEYQPSGPTVESLSRISKAVAPLA